MTAYKIIIKDKNYTQWVIYENTTFEEIKDIEIDPIQSKLFSNDVFKIKNEQIEIIESKIRLSIIPCILILSENKTYGRCGKNNKKLFYKCIPNDKSLPLFLVPYEIKHFHFSKVFTNLFVTINYINWDNKHPIGIITNVIGKVNEPNNFYEYKLCCRNLNNSIKSFIVNTENQLKNNKKEFFISHILDTFPSIQDRRDLFIFTIDPLLTTDFDDALGIKYYNNTCCLSIYISNVALWMDVLDLWSFFSQRVSTIYLPNLKKTMLPPVLSNDLCSLKSKSDRFAFVMDITIDFSCNNLNITNIEYNNAIINVSKNYYYEEKELIQTEIYKNILDITKKISQNYDLGIKIKNSHDLVSYLMIFMNYNVSKKMIEHNHGIFRHIELNPFIDSTKNLITHVNINKIFHNSTGKYIDIQNHTEHLKNEMLGINSYTHITSPIRRLVDLLNSIIFQTNLKLLTFSDKALVFYNNWLNNLNFINETMKSIRKILMV
jgi:exoribonuclease R